MIFQMLKMRCRGSENENAGNNRRFLMKIEEFCSTVQFRVLAVLLAGIRVFAKSISSSTH